VRIADIENSEQTVKTVFALCKGVRVKSPSRVRIPLSPPKSKA